MSSVVDRKAVARGRAKNWREARLANGDCPKHNNSFSRLPCCHGCFSQFSANPVHSVSSDHNTLSPKVGEILDACFQCEQCRRLYHKGSRYFGENPRRRRWNKERPRGIQPGPEGSLINYDESESGDSGRFLSLCGWCRNEGTDEWQYRRVSGWSGICDRHRPLARMQSEPWQHPVCTAWVFPSPEYRHAEAGPRNRRMKVEFICLNQEKGEHRGITYLSQTKRDSWRGLCSACQSLFPVHNKITEDVIRGGVKLGFKSPDEQGRILVTYLTCKDTRWVSREKAATLNTIPPKQGICSECRNDSVRLTERLAGNGQKNEDSEKKQWGGARNVKWTPELSAKYLATYEDVHTKVKANDASLPADVIHKASLRGNKPSDIARDYAADLLGVKSGDYLQRVLARARRERSNV